MNLELVYTDYKDSVKEAVAKISGHQEADVIAHDQLWEPLFCGELVPPDDVQLADWLIQQARGQAKKVTNKRQKEGRKVSRYTESPTIPTTPGEISDAQLCKICDVEQPENRELQVYRLGCMKLVFDQLPPADREFLIAYQVQKAKELIPRYGSSEVAIRQRVFKLKQRITKHLETLLETLPIFGQVG